MKITYVVRESESMIFDGDGEIIVARALADAKRRAFRKQFDLANNIRLEYENGDIVSIKRSGCKWEDKF